jgi:hypothetical protein
MEKVITQTTIVIGSIAAGTILVACAMLFSVVLLPFLPVYLVARWNQPPIKRPLMPRFPKVSLN